MVQAIRGWGFKKENILKQHCSILIVYIEIILKIQLILMAIGLVWVW